MNVAVCRRVRPKNYFSLLRSVQPTAVGSGLACRSAIAALKQAEASSVCAISLAGDASSRLICLGNSKIQQRVEKVAAAALVRHALNAVQHAFGQHPIPTFRTFACALKDNADGHPQ